MITSRTPFAALLASLALTACVADDEAGSFDEATGELSSSGWTSPSYVDDDYSYPPAMAMLDGVEYYVYAQGTSFWGTYTHALSWHQCDGITCTDSRSIPGQKSLDRVNLAAFNGYIYMVHQGDTDDTAVWFSRLDTTTGQWTTNVKLPFTTVGGAPALAAFNNRLYLVGSREVEVTRHGTTITTYPLWYASMGADETWQAARSIAGQSASPPSLAVLGNRLYLAHQNGATADIAIRSMPIGGSWSAAARIPSGPNNAYLQGTDVQLAAVNGYLHLVHHRLDDDLTYWTYNRGCDDWAPEISVDALRSDWRLSMATGINGLVLSRLTDWVENGTATYHWWRRSRFIAPPAPMTLPDCGAQL